MLLPVSSNVPVATDAILNVPAPLIMPLHVNTTDAVPTLMVEVVELVNEIFLLVEDVTPEYKSVPPLKIISVPAPILVFVPAASMVATDSVPAETVADPV